MSQKILLFVAALSLLFIGWCIRLGRLLGEHFASYRQAVTR